MQPNRGSRACLDPATAVPVLQDLAQLHQGVLLADPDGRVAWVSDALAASIGETPAGRWESLFADPERGTELWNALHDGGRLTNESAELATTNGRRLSVALTAVRLACEEEAGPVVVLVRSASQGNGIERELSHSIGYMRAILDCSPDAVVVVDTSGFVTYANPAVERLLGYSSREALDQPIAVYLHRREDLDRIAAALRSTTRVESRDVEVRRRDGTVTRVSISASALFLPEGTRIGSVAFLRETEQGGEVEATLQRKNAELEHTLQAVSHDLRSPLVALLGFSKLLREDFAEHIGDKGRRYLHRIEQAGRTMESLIHDLLEFSRIDETRMHKSLVDPREVLLQLQAELKSRLEAQGTRLQFPDSPPLLNCDRTRLYQVLSNLVGNALDHMGPTSSPRIVVELGEVAHEHRITVRDNGRGIPEADHARIFELFQSANPRADGRRGTGVGLAIVKKIAETHGGRVWVESTPGDGASFHVTLPRASEPGSSLPR